MTNSGWRVGHRGARKRAARLALLMGCLLLTLLVPRGAAAQTWDVNPYLDERWYVRFDGFYPSIDTSARLDSSTLGTGTEVNFERDLGFDDADFLPALLASVRLGRRWKIEFEYFALDRDVTHAIGETIQWGDAVFPFETTVSAAFDTDVYRLSGSFAIVSGDSGQVGVTFGAHITRFFTTLAAANLVAEDSDVLAPLPTVGAFGSFAFSRRWLVNGRFDYFGLSLDDYDGSLINVNAGVQFQIIRHVGVGAGYRYVNYEIGLTNPSWTGNVDYEFQGPTVFVAASF